MEATKIWNSLHVGVANRGTWPLHACRPESTGFRPVAVCDTSQDALKNAMSITGIEADAAFTDYHEALRNSGADCVIICTPTKFHVPMTVAAIEAGLPVLVEKGMASNWKDAQALVAVCRDAKVPVVVSQNYRYGSTARTIHRALHDKAWEFYLGSVHHILYWQNRVRPEPRTLDYPWGSIWDVSCHHLDNLLFWLSTIDSLTASAWSATWSPYSSPHNTSAHIIFDSGTVATYGHTHDAARASEEIQLHGDRGALFYRDGKFEFSTRPKTNFGTSPVTQVTPIETENESDLLRDFRGWLDGGPEPGISARNNLETMACCEMMVRSIENGCSISRSDLDT